MNNEQFRKLMLASSAKSEASKDGRSPPSATASGGGSLGSRQRASIPMTPRAVGGAQADFARQLAERNRVTQPQKKFKTSTPKGIQLGSGYVDRAGERNSETADDREQRVKALEEAYKKEEISKEAFEKLRLEVAGGDLESTHLVKGLDFKLLERIRRGEDVYSTKSAEDTQEEPEAGVDDEFDQLEQQEVEAIAREDKKKKGQLSTVSLAPGKKRTRDQILADFKAARLAAKAKQEPALGDRFRRIGAKQEAGSRIEVDAQGREVLIIVDEDGHEKRKVRKVQRGQDDEARRDLMMPSKDAKPLGMEVPEQYRKNEEPEDDNDMDIFDGVGDDYDPLAGMDASSDSDDDDTTERKDTKPEQRDEEEGEVSDSNAKEGSMAPPPKPTTTARNYFKDSKTGLVSEEASKAPSMSDPAIMAAIKRAAALNPISKGDEDEDEDEEEQKEKKAREERRRRMLESSSRDDVDLDMGFGTSRFEDEEDFDDDQKPKLSVWGEDDGEDGHGSRGGKAKRKRGPKKRKADGNNAADVLRVMEQRKK